jgi:hypothetical protein
MTWYTYPPLPRKKQQQGAGAAAVGSRDVSGLPNDTNNKQPTLTNNLMLAGPGAATGPHRLPPPSPMTKSHTRAAAAASGGGGGGSRAVHATGGGLVLSLPSPTNGRAGAGAGASATASTATNSIRVLSYYPGSVN